MMIPKNQNLALIVGIANYAHISSLSDVVRSDALDLCSILADSDLLGISPEQTRILLDQDATKPGIYECLDFLKQEATPQTTVWLYFSGHGGHTASQTYLITHETQPDALEETALAGGELQKQLAEVPAGRFVLIFDCCHADGLLKTTTGKALPIKQGLPDAYLKALSTSRGRVIMSASRSDEYSYILSGMKNSLFTHYLLMALRGHAANTFDETVRILDVYSYIIRQMQNHPRHSQQHPVLKANMEDNFPVIWLNAPVKQPSEPLQSVNPTQLRRLIARNFDRDELELLVVDLNRSLKQAGYDEDLTLQKVTGDHMLERMVMDLIGYMERRGLLADLVSAVREARPGLNFSDTT